MGWRRRGWQVQLGQRQLWLYECTWSCPPVWILCSGMERLYSRRVLGHGMIPTIRAEILYYSCSEYLNAKYSVIEYHIWSLMDIPEIVQSVVFFSLLSMKLSELQSTCALPSESTIQKGSVYMQMSIIPVVTTEIICIRIFRWFVTINFVMPLHCAPAFNCMWFPMAAMFWHIHSDFAHTHTHNIQIKVELICKSTCNLILLSFGKHCFVDVNKIALCIQRQLSHETRCNTCTR